MLFEPPKISPILQSISSDGSAFSQLWKHVYVSLLGKLCSKVARATKSETHTCSHNFEEA